MGRKRVINGEKYLRVGRAAKLLQMTIKEVRARAVVGEIETILRNGQRLYPIGAVQAYATRHGTIQQTDEALDALAFSMMAEGSTNETIVTALRVSLDRVLRLRQHRDGTTPAAVRDEAAATAEAAELAAENALSARRRELADTLERERQERKKRLYG